MNRKGFMFILMIILMLVITGNKSEYRIFTEKFEKNYIKVVLYVDTSNTLENLKLIHSNQEEISQLRILLHNIKDKVPENKIEEYQAYQQDYEVLLFLSNIVDSWDWLTPEELKEVEDKILEVTVKKEYH
jgi:exopolysaccharide biosynthesis predicted pyruvyltransferase EpsI